jgi:hypothetical protein
MRQYRNLIIIMVAQISLMGCKKDLRYSPSPASLTIFNGLNDMQPMYVSFGDTAVPFYSYENFIQYGSSFQYSVSDATTPIRLTSAEDTLQPWIQGKMSLEAGGIYSLYVAGKDGKQIDTLLSKDVLPSYSDSTAGVRFINLMESKREVTINLEGNSPDQPEFGSIGFKQSTAFKGYSARTGILSYNFEIHDKQSGEMITTFSWSLKIFRNTTIVILGQDDPSGALTANAFQVNHF